MAVATPTNADTIVGDLMAYWRSLSSAELALLAEMGPSVSCDREKAAKILALAREIR